MLAKTYNNILVVSGSGRDSGKTTFVCGLLKRFEQLDCIAIKISPHFHELTKGLIMLHKTENYQIARETDSLGKKDTNRMLASGANQVLYVQCSDQYLGEIQDKIPLQHRGPVIIESGGIAAHLKNSLHICIKKEGSVKPCTASHVIVNSHDIAAGINRLSFKNNCFVWDY